MQYASQWVVKNDNIEAITIAKAKEALFPSLRTMENSIAKAPEMNASNP